MDRRERLFDEIRRAELDLAARYLPRNGRVLELGGGSGLQAALLAERGLEVVSLDLSDRPPPAHEHHPIEVYDGVHIPYPDGSFDGVFSSNVLEHVVELDRLLSDTARVLKPAASAVHLMPTPSWRAWTSLTYVLGLPVRVADQVRRRFRREPPPDVPRGSGAEAGGQGRPLTRRVRDFVVAEPHGHPDASALRELATFGSRAWTTAFERNGFELVESRGNGLYYSGYLILPRLTIARRRALSVALGSSCRLYHVRPAVRRAQGPASSVAGSPASGI